MGANDSRGTANLDPRGIVGRIYVGDHQTSLHTCFVSYAPHSFREEDFLMFFSYIALYKHMTPWGEASLEPSGLVSKIYVGDHLRLLYTKYISCGPQAFREEDFFKVFSIISLWELIWLIWRGQFRPQGLDWQDLCRGPLNIATH